MNPVFLAPVIPARPRKRPTPLVWRSATYYLALLILEN